MRRISTLKIFLVLIFLALVATTPFALAGISTGSGPWKWVEPDVQGNTIYSVHFVNDTTGWGVGIGGTILHTTDGGTTWVSQLNTSSCDGVVIGNGCNLYGVTFYDANNGWAVGDYGTVWRTTNGGANWTQSTVTGKPSLKSVSFISSTQGLAVGDAGAAYYSNNGGASWIAATAKPSSSHDLSSVQMIDASTGYAAGSGGSIYKTTNGGVNWTAQTSTLSGIENISSVHFIDATNGFAAGGTAGSGKILRTTNGGTTWVANSASAIGSNLWEVSVSGNNLIAVGDDGAILRRNSANNWTDPIDTVAAGLASVSSGTTSRLHGLSLVGATGYASGEAGAITKTINSGGSWAMVAGGNPESYLASSFISADEGWMAGAGARIIKTMDSGDTWTNDNAGIPANVNINGIHMLSPNLGFAAGCQGDGCSSSGTGVVYKYNGTNWTSMSPPATGPLFSVHMSDATHGWAVGAGGTTLRTTNGNNWNAVTGVPSNISINSVDSFGDNSAWAAGQVTGGSGVIYRYNGSSWTQATVPSPPSFMTSIDMIDTTTGYAVGSGGKVYKTTNGGSSWVAQTSGTSKLLASVSFWDPYNGVVAGDEGRIIKTTNGGATWSLEAAGTNIPLYTVTARKDNPAPYLIAFAGGSGGIVKTPLTMTDPKPYYFTWYDSIGSSGQNWVLMANPSGAGSDIWFDLFIGGYQMALSPLTGTGCPGGGSCSIGQIPQGRTLYARYDGLRAGPVVAASKNNDSAIVSQRVVWGSSSLEEVLGVDEAKLSSHFYWTLYDSSAGYQNWVMISNTNTFDVDYEVTIGGDSKESGTIASGQSTYAYFDGVKGGPLEVTATSALDGTPATVLASQRVLTNGGQSFNEAPGIPEAELSDHYVWTWYDSIGGTDEILVGNPSDAAIQYDITIGGVDMGGPFTVNPHTTDHRTFAGLKDGPVDVQTSSPAEKVVASQRIVWGPSMGDVPGYPYASLSDTYWWTWYDWKSPGSNNWIMAAPDPANTQPVHVYAQFTDSDGQLQETECVVDADGPDDPPRCFMEVRGKMGGPLKVWAVLEGTSTPADVLVSQRVLWGGHFNEVLGTVMN